MAVASGTTWASAELDPSTPTGSCLFGPARGDGIDNREHRHASVLRIAIRGTIHFGKATDLSASVTETGSVRLVLVLDRQTNGVQMSAEDCLHPQTAGRDHAHEAFMNIAKLGRFQILKDKTYRAPERALVWNATTATTMMNGADLPFKIKYRFYKPLEVHFNDNTNGGVDDIVDNSLHLIGHTNHVDIPVTLTYNVRTYFID